MKTESKRKSEASPKTEQQRFRFRLFVAGDEPNSRKAKAVLQEFCSQVLKEEVDIQIIDVMEDYQAAINSKVVVIPTLIVDSPFPGLTIIGSLEDKEKLKACLGLTYEN